MSLASACRILQDCGAATGCSSKNRRDPWDETAAGGAGASQERAAVGIYSLCSAHPTVIDCALKEARAAGAPLLIEATSNQVNQFGGYTGMTPDDFRGFVQGIARRVDFPAERLWLGGDHLGPNAWRKEPAETAMEKSEVLIRQYVTAGFRKIHLDCSMACADDPEPVPEDSGS